MIRRFLKTQILIISSVLALIVTMGACSAYGASTVVQVNPLVTNIGVGKTFNINITVTDVNLLYAWQFKLYYLNTIVNCINITEGPFLSSGGSTFFISNVTNNFNSTHGRVSAACTLTGPGRSANGTGILARLFFNTLSEGSSNLDLGDTKLSDINAQPMAFTPISGRVRVGGTGTVHDLAVANVVAQKKTIGKGFPDNITVTVQNLGDFTETFNVTARANSTDIGTRQLSLDSGDFVSVIFTWNTASFIYGRYIVSAYVAPVANETDVDNNNMTDGTVTVTIVGDINGDGIVDIYDAILLSASFNGNPSATNWNPNADLNCDGIVDIFDAILLANNFNKHI
jgi:hypothetical protein